MSKPHPSRTNLTDLEVGRLVVIGYSHTKSQPNGDRVTGVTFWNCKCACGRECTVRGSYLKSGLTKSCGSPECKLANRRETMAAKKKANDAKTND